MISKPKEYIDILLNDLVKNVQIAVKNHYQETFNQMCPLFESENRFHAAMERVDKIKEEIIYIVQSTCVHGHK